MIPGREPPPLIALYLLALGYPFVLHVLLLRWFASFYRFHINPGGGLLINWLDDRHKFGAIYGVFGMGLFNLVVWLPITIVLSPFFLAYMIYAIGYWTCKNYILQ